jgi:hypothetical protein
MQGEPISSLFQWHSHQWFTMSRLLADGVDNIRGWLASRFKTVNLADAFHFLSERMSRLFRRFAPWIDWYRTGDSSNHGYCECVSVQALPYHSGWHNFYKKV